MRGHPHNRYVDCYSGYLLMSSPKLYTNIFNEVDRIKTHFASRLDRPCLIVGNGPSAAQPTLSSAEIESCVIFRMNWFFLETEKVYGHRVDGYFSTVRNEELDKRVRDLHAADEYEVGAYFTPLYLSEKAGSIEHDEFQIPEFDQWAVLASEPTYARFLMGRPLPTQGMQVIAFAASVGFREIYVSGIDMYAAAARRYAWALPKDVKAHLQSKDVEVGYEKNHSLDVDLKFLQAVRANSNARVYKASKQEIISPYLDAVPGPAYSVPSPRPAEEGLSRFAYVTYVEGEYFLGAIALARSLKKVSDVPLIVMYTKADIPMRLRHISNIILKRVEPVPNPHNHGQKRFAATYNKLRVFELTEFQRLVFVDADCVFLKSADGLFADKGFHAAPDWGYKLNDEFNSGVFAFDPSEELRNHVLGNISNYGSRDGGDQGYLNSVLKHRWSALRPEYNSLKRIFVHHPSLMHLSDTVIMHFTGKKPWQTSGSDQEYNFLSKYWYANLQSEDFHHYYWYIKSNCERPRKKRSARNTAKRFLLRLRLYNILRKLRRLFPPIFRK